MVLSIVLSICLLGLLARTRQGSKRQKAQRRRCLDACVDLFDEYNLKIAVDGFARLTGRAGAQCYQVGLIPDTMTIKRLPQLWLSLSMPLVGNHDSIAVTARPRTDDFFSSSFGLKARLDVPTWLPQDLSIRSEMETAASWVQQNREALQKAFSDPLLKEVAISATGLRLIYRLAEGDRGQHLLFRQSSFEPQVSRELLLRLQAMLHSFMPTIQLERAA